MGGHEGTVGKGESPAREAADNPADQKNRVEALAATFRRLNSAKNAEAMYFFPDMLVSLAALPGGDFPLLFQVMESDGKLDGESAITPLLRWASLDPRAALTFALGRKEFNSSERVLSAIVYQLARSDLSAAKTALANFPEKSEERRDAQRAIVKVLLEKDPKAAIAYAREDLPVHIAQRWWWAKAPPQLVADWATSLPAGPARDAAIGEVGRLWVKQDAMEASHWIDKVPASPGRDKVVTQLIQEISSDAPNDAFVWSGTIQDPALRRNMREASISEWAAKDIPAALAALETLPVEQRGTLREKSRRSRRWNLKKSEASPGGWSRGRLSKLRPGKALF